MKKILPLFIPVFFFWPMKLVEWWFTPTYEAESTQLIVDSGSLSLASCSTCPEMVGLMVDPCNTSGCSPACFEQDNEYAIFMSGNGFAVNDLLLDLDINNNIIGPENDDPGSATCPLMEPQSSLISALQSMAPCIESAGPDDVIPCCAVVVLFTSSAGPNVVNDLSYICGLGFDIYVLQNSCDRTAGAFTNGGGSGTRTYSISIPSCSDAITYDRSTFPAVAPLADNVIVDEFGTAYVTTGSCQPDLSNFTFPALPSLPDIDAIITDESCPGQSNGAINLTITGGMSPYCIDWEHLTDECPVSDPEDISGLPAGEYSVIVTDASGCIAVEDFEVISGVSPIDIEPFPTGTTCAGQATGAVFIVITGGSSPYTFDWDYEDTGFNDDFDSNPVDGIEDQDPINLYSGWYFVTVTDATGCIAIDSVHIDEDATEISLSFNINQILCFGQTTSIDMSVAGGLTFDYQFDWDTDGTGDFDDPEDLISVSAGTYTIVVMEFTTGCTIDTTITIAEPADLVVSTTPTDALCDNSTGSYVITVSGGVGPYDYSDGTNSGTDLAGPTITVSNVNPGTYTVTVTDANGCTATDVVTIGAPDAITIDFFPSGTTCAGQPTGSVFIVVSGGSPAYTFDWDWLPGMGNEVFDENPMDGIEDQDLDSLYSGMYSLTVTDANGCSTVGTVQIDEDASDIIAVAPDITLDCFGDLADIDLSVSGGINGTYVYDWDNDGTGDNDDPQDLNDVPAGTYNVTITENVTGCEEYHTVVVTQPTEVVVTAVGDTAVCGGAPSGSYSITFGGGTPPYDYIDNASPPNSGTDVTGTIVEGGIFAGTYSITVTDANGCTDVTMVTIEEIDEISAVVSAPPIICFDGTTSVTVTPSGGTAPFCYDWNAIGGANCGMDISEPATLVNMPAGSYSVTVLDANGCMTVAGLTISEPPLLTGTFDTSFCAGESVVVFGQTYTVADTYMDTLLSVDGCDSVITITITEDPLFMDAVTETLCPGDSVLIHGVYYSSTGMFVDTIDGGAGCDTIINITINPLPDITNNITDSFCDSDTYTLPDGSTTTTSGSFGPFVFTAGNGCDSIVNVTLTLLSESMNNITDSFCDSDTYTLPDGSTTTTGGSFGPYMFTAANGCDSIVNVTLTLLPESMNNITDSFCDSDTYTLPDGSTTTTGGSFGPYIFTAANGCDSIVNVTLTLLPESMNNITDSFCDSDTYTLPDGSTTTTGGSFGPFIFTAANGCDSIVNVTLTLLPESMNNITDSFCDSDTYTLPDGSTTTTGGSFGPYMFVAANGCDSIVNVTLTLLPESINNISDQFCENTTYTLPDGSTTMSPGTYGPFMFTAANGCDSIVTVNLTEVPEIINNISDSFCDSDTYTLPDGSTTTVGGTFGPYIYTSANGCDSIVTVNLSLLPESLTNISDSFCDSDTYTLPDGSTTTTGGSFGPYIFIAANGCDSIVNVTLTLLPESINNISDSFCDSDSYTLPDGSTTTTGGSFGPFIFTAANGCDSIVNVTLTLLPESMNNITDSFCDSDAYTLPDGSTTTTGGSFGPYVFTAANGCDSIVNVTLTLLPESINNISDQFCENTTYVLPDGSTTMSPGTYGPYMFIAMNGCDSIVTVNLSEVPEILNDITDDFCDGDTYTLPDGSTTSTGGIFGPYTYTSANGCDSIVTVTLALLPVSINNIVDDFCDSDTYALPDGSTTTTGGTFGPYIFVAANGCDSIVNVTLTLLPESINNIIDSFCDGDTYTLPDGTTTTNGGSFGPYMFTAANGCDSIVNVTLTLLPESVNNITDSFCDGDTYTLPDGSTTTTGGNYGPYTFTAANGCDSIVNVSLTLLPESINDIADQFCENTTYTLPDGSTTMSGGIYGPYMFTAANGCDSIVTVDLTEVPEIINNISDDFCDGDSYTLPDGSTTTTGGMFGPYVYVSGSGCDSIVNVSLTMLPVSINNISDEFCDGDTYTLPDGSGTTTGGSFGPFLFIAANGCDSIVNVTLTLLPESTNNISDSFCDGDTYTLPDGSTASTGGNFGPYLFVAANGCDSIVNVSLTLLPESITDISDSFCDSDTYTLPDGSTTTTGGSFGPYIFVAGNGCDSIVNVTLALLPESINNFSDQFCENSVYTLPDGSTTMAGGVYGPYTFTAANGCDSLVTVDLTEVPEITNNISDDFCDGDTYTLPDGSTTSVGGTFGPFTFTAGNGCDSIVNVSLALLPESNTNIIDDFCDGDTYTLPDGGTTMAGGNFGPYTFTAANGCDSIVNVTLTLLPESTTDILDDFCDGDTYTLPDGSTTSTGGTFGPFTFTAANGCDSIVNVTLTLLPESMTDIVDDFCDGDSYALPDGSTTTVGGTFGPYLFTAANGCDSIVNVSLTLLPESTNDIVDSFCENDTYILPDGSTTSVGGSFGPYTFTAANGCDSIVTVDLSLIPEIVNDITDSFCDGDSYILPDGSSTNTGGSFGPYLFTSSSGCDSIVNVSLTLLPESNTNIVDDFCDGDIYTLPDGGTTTVGGSFGPYTFTAANGCDSIVNVSLTLLPESTSDIADDFCDGDTYTLPDGSTTSTGGSFGPFMFTAANGCDSIVNVTLTLLPESVTDIVDDFCDGDTYTLPDGGATTVGGSFGPYLFTAANGCDSVVNVTLALLPESINDIVDAFCENDTYTLPDGSTTSTGGSFGPYLFTAANGCDSIVTVDLTLIPEIVNDITDSFCDGDTYTLPDGSTTSVGGSFGPYQFTSSGGCDSIVNVLLTLLPESNTNIVDDFCDGDTYTLPDGGTTTVGGNFGPYTFTAANGCDSIVNVTLTLLPESTTDIIDDFCDGDTYTLPDGSTTSIGGSFGPFMFTAANGCDSIVNVTLTLLPESVTDIVDNFCDGDTYTLPDGSTTTVGGSFGPYLFTAANGCDSIVNVTLTLLPESTNDIVDSFCENDTYTLPDGSSTSVGGGFGPYLFTAANGCDSVVNVELTQIPEIVNDITDSFCDGDTYTLPDGSTTSVGGSFGPYQFTSSGGCDSIVNVSLTLLPESNTNIVDDFCDGDTYTLPDGSTTTIGGSFGPYTFTAANGCDSIVNVTLTLLPEATNDIIDEFCDGDTYSLPDGSTTSIGGSFGPFMFTAANGCDSIVNVTLTLLPESVTDIVDDFCDGDTYTLPDGSTTTVGGSFGPYLFTAANGCDSVVNVDLTLIPEVTNDIVDVFCENSTYTLPDGSTTTTGGFYGPYLFISAAGCDSIVTVDLTEISEVTTDIDDSFCEGDSYTLPDGSSTSVGGDFGPYLFTSSSGCDSIVNVSLTLVPDVVDDLSDSFCEGDTYTLPDGGTTTTGGAFGPYLFTSASGCDSIVNLMLVLLPEPVTDIVDDFCEGDTYSLPDGSTTIVGGSFGPFVFVAGNGCDSIVNVELTLLPGSSTDIADSFCEGDSYTLPDGNTTDVGGSFGPYTFVAANGCDSVVSVTLTLVPDVSNDIVDSFCEDTPYTLPDGSTTIDGGVFGPYNFTSASGCDSIVTVDLTEVPALTNDIVTTFCEGSTYTLPDGSTTTTGGFYGPYTFVSTSGCDSIVTVDLTGIDFTTGEELHAGCEGDGYFVVVNGNTYDEGNPTGTEILTAQSGCDSIVTIDLDFAPAPDAQIDPIGPFCPDSGPQTLTATPPGGVWSGDVSSDQFDPGGMGPGQYEVIYTVTQGSCSDADTLIIVVHPQIMLSCTEIAQESAPGAMDGIGGVNVSNGTAPYNIIWTGPINGSDILSADGTYQITGLTMGSYNVVVVDANGCAGACFFTITVGAGCTVQIDSVQVVDASCPGSANGEVTIFASGGVPPYMYSFDGVNFQSDNRFDDIPSGSWFFYVQDAAGCVASIPVDVGAGEGPVLSLVSVQPASCGFDNGSIQVAATGGSSPYEFSRDGTNYQPVGTFNGLATGTYTIYVLDDGGCGDTIQVDVPSSGAPVIDALILVDPGCGQFNGSITIEASGEAVPFMYSIGGAFQSSNFFSGLPSGNYLVTVIDTNDCTDTELVSLNSPNGPTFITNVTPTTCGANDGEIEVIASNGTPPYQYRIDMMNPWTTNNVFSGLGSGNYLIEVRDANGCITSANVNVVTTDGPQINSTPVVHTSCGEDDGEITVNASGGTGDLTYCIDPGNCQGDDNEFEGLSDGTYTITVIDEGGCSAEEIVVINDSEGPTVDVIQNDEKCGQGNGSIIIFGIGGTEPYQYSLNRPNGPFTFNDSYFNLSSDFYEICVRDANGCIDCKEIFIDNDLPPENLSAVTTPSKCSESTGTITISATSLPPAILSYSIDNCNNTQSSNVFTGVAAGTYIICVTDQFGCSSTMQVVVGPTTFPSIDDVDVIDAACTEPGSITVLSSGGTGQHEYSLNNIDFQSSPVFPGLGAGTYTVYVRDSLECTDQASVTILGPMLDNVSIDATICEGDSIEFGSTFYNVTGIYMATFTGSDGCDSIVTLDLTVEFCCTNSESTFDETICEGDTYTLNDKDYSTSGIHRDTIIGGASNGCDSILILDLDVISSIVDNQSAEICAGETYQWNSLTLSQAGIYTDTLTSLVTGCDSILVLNLLVNALPDVDAGSDQTLTCSVTTVTLNGSGEGTPSWTGPAVVSPDAWSTDATGAGVYFLTATSSDGCTAVDSVAVFADPNLPIANAGPDQFITCDDTTVVLQGSANLGGMEFNWTGTGIQPGDEQLEMPVVQEAGIYILYVENPADGCVSAPDTVIVTDLRADLLANITASGNLDCINDQVLLTAGGSSTGTDIVFIWLNPEDMISLNVSSINATIPGTYFLFVIDSISMCQAVDSHDVLQLIEIPLADAGADTVLDCRVGFLPLDANADGQQVGLEFSWAGPAGGIVTDPNQHAITIIEPGEYIVTVLNPANGCTSMDTVIVIDSRDLPEAEAGPSQFLNCREDTAILDASGSSQGSEYVYTWNGPGIQNVQSISIEVELPGWYHLVVMNMETGCEASDSAEVQMSDFLTGAGILVDDPFCLNDSSGQITIQLPDGGVPPYQYSLDGIIFQTSPVFANLPAGTYSVIIQDAVDCEWDTTIVINDGPELIINIGPDLELDFGEMADLQAVVIPPGIVDSIVWTPADALSCTHCIDPVLTAIYQHDFIVMATAYAGNCVDSDDLLVIVDNEFDIFVPNVFSPNNDNINDFVTAFGGDAVKRILEFEIFDRWGELIFKGEDFPLNVPELGWDGKFKGEFMNPGVFVYKLKVELIDGSEMILSGDITLVR